MENKIRKAEEERPQPQDRTPNISKTVIKQNINLVHNVCQQINCNCDIGVNNNSTTTEQYTSNPNNSINIDTVNNFIIPINSSIGTDSDVPNSTNHNNVSIINNVLNENISERTQTSKNKII